jgi:hypothetical protein
MWSYVERNVDGGIFNMKGKFLERNNELFIVQGKKLMPKNRRILFLGNNRDKLFLRCGLSSSGGLLFSKLGSWDVFDFVPVF